MFKMSHHSDGPVCSIEYATAQQLPWCWSNPASSTRSADVLWTPSHHGMV